jgi:hypothetical protein
MAARAPESAPGRTFRTPSLVEMLTISMLGAEKSLSSMRCCGNRTTKTLQRVEIGEEIVELLLGERAADGGHHIAAAENGLADESFVGGQTAGQELLLEQAFEAGAILSGDGVRVVAGGASLLIEMASGGLLRVQIELGVGFSRGVIAATGEECQESDAGEE